jgi:hypothetical protein
MKKLLFLIILAAGGLVYIDRTEDIKPEQVEVRKEIENDKLTK